MLKNKMLHFHSFIKGGNREGSGISKVSLCYLLISGQFSYYLWPSSHSFIVTLNIMHGSHNYCLNLYTSRHLFLEEAKEFAKSYDLTGSGFKHREEQNRKKISILQDELLLLESGGHDYVKIMSFSYKIYQINKFCYQIHVD